MKKKYVTLVLIFLIIILIFLSLNFLSIHVLQILDYTSDNLVFQETICPGEHFSLKYTHSVAQTPVWEFFEIAKNGDLILVETHFLDHGAGLPYTSFGDEVFVNEQGKFKIKNMSRKISLPLFYRIGKRRENFFIYKNQEINLSKILGDSVVIINITKMNLFNYFINKFII